MTKRIVVFGTGSAAKDFLTLPLDDTQVIGLVDNDPAKHGARIEGHAVSAAEAIAWSEVDYVVIAARAVDAIRAQLVALDVSEDRVLAFYPSFAGRLNDEANRDIRALNDVFGLAIPAIGLATMYLDLEPADKTEQGPRDFVRNQTFRLAARQIRDRGVAGAVAELGVYQGDQARLINGLFPDRSLYLFDTFSGFSERDLHAESSQSFSTASLGDFSNTSVSMVMGKLPFPAMATAFPGYFPDSATNVDDRFAFVSLDVDLFEPTLAGLNWFYDRLSPGGYIFVHDYNNRRYLGVKSAVDQFVEARGACCIPLADFAGSIIITR